MAHVTSVDDERVVLHESLKERILVEGRGRSLSEGGFGTSSKPDEDNLYAKEHKDTNGAGEVNEKEEKQKRLRIKVLEEIVTTEKAYVADLHFIIKNFVTPLKKLISEEDSALIFSNIATIQSVHQTIWASLADRVWGSPASPNPPTAVPGHVSEPADPGGSPRGKQAWNEKIDHDFLIADIFVKNADYLKFYTTYTLNQSESLQAIRRLKQNSVTFNAFLRGMQNKKTDIGSYLIKPVQRICKYPLLLRELLKYTPASHPDHENLNAALERVQSVATHVDVHNQRVQNIAKMMEIQRSLLLGKGIKFEVIKPSRSFVQEGDLAAWKVGAQRPDKTLRAFLFNDVLLLAKRGKEHKGEQRTEDGSTISQASYSFEMKFALKLTQVREVDQRVIPNAFELLQPQSAQQGRKAKGSLKGSSSVILQASSGEERHRWVGAITQCKRELQAKIIAQINATSESKKFRASMIVSNLPPSMRKDDDEGTSTNEDDQSASSDPCYSPRESRESTDLPRELPALANLRELREDEPAEMVRKNALLSVPREGAAGMSKSLPSSPSSRARRRSSSYTSITMTPQVFAREKERERERQEKDRRKKDKKERKAKLADKEKKKKKRAVKANSDGEEVLPEDGEQEDEGGGSGRRKKSGRNLFPEEEEEGGQDEATKGENKNLTKVVRGRDRSRSRSYNHLPSPEMPRPKGVAFMVDDNDKLTGSGKLALPPPPKPTGPKPETLVDLKDDDDDDPLLGLRQQLADARRKKNKWKDKYFKMKEKYEELQKKMEASQQSNDKNEAESPAPKKTSPRDTPPITPGGTMDNLAKVLAGMSSDPDTPFELQEREMQLLLAQRKNELEEKKKLLESKRRELEEKRRETGAP